jgi:diguanylate cyclase (GGDEF)-like protein
MTDDLTGLANMRSFTEHFSEALRRCRKSKVALGVIMLDIDHFKNVNDTTNHLMGSYVLGAVGQILRTRGALASTDFPARYGGDEFIILSEVESQIELEEKADQLRLLIAQEIFERDGDKVMVTASFGAAFVPPGYAGRGDDLIKAADLMLYYSKNHGRNRVSGVTLPKSGEFEMSDLIPQETTTSKGMSQDKPNLRLLRL